MHTPIGLLHTGCLRQSVCSILGVRRAPRLYRGQLSDHCDSPQLSAAIGGTRVAYLRGLSCRCRPSADVLALFYGRPACVLGVASCRVALQAAGLLPMNFAIASSFADQGSSCDERFLCIRQSVCSILGVCAFACSILGVCRALRLHSLPPFCATSCGLLPMTLAVASSFADQGAPVQGFSSGSSRAVVLVPPPASGVSGVSVQWRLLV